MKGNPLAVQNRAEQLAPRVIETAMPGTRLRFNQDQSYSRADYAITRNDAEIGALEATCSTVEKREQIRSLLRRHPFVQRKFCQSDWSILVSENARIKQVRNEIDQYLRNIEALGMSRFFSQMDSRVEPIRRIWTELCVEAGWKTKLKRPGIGIYPPPCGGRARPEYVWQALQTEITKPDNLHKLRRSGGSHRHLFVVIEGLQGPAYVSIRSCEPPTGVPKLPPQITHVWAVAEEGDLLYVWLADREGWHNLTDRVN